MLVQVSISLQLTQQAERQPIFLSSIYPETRKQMIFFFFFQCKGITLAVRAVIQVVDNHQGFVAGKEESSLGVRELLRGVERGAERGAVPVLGTEEGFLVRLRPDELVSPACGARTGDAL